MSVVVPVPVVGGVAVPLVQVVDMIAVGHGHMPTAVAVGVGVPAALGVPDRLALVVVLLVGTVQVGIVDVVDVAVMGDGHVPTPGSVAVFGDAVVRGVRGCGGHSFSWGAWVDGVTDDLTDMVSGEPVS